MDEGECGGGHDVYGGAKAVKGREGKKDGGGMQVDARPRVVRELDKE